MKSQELLRILIKICKADEFLDEFELAYLIKVGHHLKLENQLVEDMITSPDLDYRPVKMPKSESDRMAILYHMLFMMRIDRKIADEEKDIVLHYGFKLGFPRSMIEEFIDVMESYAYKEVPTEIMLGIIRKYQN